MRRLFYILAIFLLIGLQSQAQSPSRGLPAAVGDRIVKLYPNPATTYITFELPKEFEKTHVIQVYSFMGKKVFETQTRNQKTTIDLSDFNRGLYIYHLVDIATGKIAESGKFQVSH